uniref:Uncharacterized protein n=1 Tax=Leersia perrieri TaxID=77586 RepID=A0A0D9XGQ7_9ORYZ
MAPRIPSHNAGFGDHHKPPDERPAELAADDAAAAAATDEDHEPIPDGWWFDDAGIVAEVAAEEEGGDEDEEPAAEGDGGEDEQPAVDEGSDGEDDEEFAPEAVAEEASPIHRAPGEDYIEVTSLDDIMSVVDFPQMYSRFDLICILGFTFVDAPRLLEMVLNVGRAEDRPWLVGNLGLLKEVGLFRGSFMRVSSSVERLLMLWKRHRVLEIDWDFVHTIQNAVALLPPLSDQQPENLRDTVAELLERLKVMLPVQPADGSNNSDALASSELISDMEKLVIDMSALELLHIRYTPLEPSACTSGSRGDATKLVNKLHDALALGWRVGNMNTLKKTSSLRVTLSRMAESLTYVTMALDEKEIDWFEVKRIREGKDKLIVLCEDQPPNLCGAVLAFVANVDLVLSDLPPKPDDTHADYQIEYHADVLNPLADKLKNLQDEIKTIQVLRVEYSDAPMSEL